MSLAHLLEAPDPMTFALSVDMAYDFGLLLRRRDHWAVTNVADEAVTVRGRNLPIGVATRLRPFDIITIGEIRYCFIPVLEGAGPNE